MKSSDGQIQFLTLGYEDCPAGEKPARFGFQCPYGRGWCSGLLITGADLGTGIFADRARSGKAPMWDWDGNVEAPTFSPSINCLEGSGCGWHGYIVGGKVV
jgi:hypothetical protein